MFWHKTPESRGTWRLNHAALFIPPRDATQVPREILVEMGHLRMVQREVPKSCEATWGLYRLIIYLHERTMHLFG